MFVGDRDNDTICAVSTPPGVGGISIIRLSGNNSVEISKKIAPFVPTVPESHRVYYGVLKSGLDSLESIDEVLVTYFQAGRSFTGENIIEVSCHGNPVICERILKTLVNLGARIAEPGEFTYRAFMNGRLDLVQAESVLSLIQGQSKKATEIALMQLKGGISEELLEAEDNLVWILANLEASIDFSTEDIEVVDFALVLEKLRNVNGVLKILLDSYKTGRKIFSGYQTVFIGAPNVGKSSLLNNLLKEDRAIVSNIPGTTRDVINDSILIDGVTVTFSDTAGLRDTEDLIESIGVKKSIDLVEKADLIFFVVDSLNYQEDSSFDCIIKHLEKTVFLVNKDDLLGDKSRTEILAYFDINRPKSEIHFVSALKKSCGDELKEIVRRVLLPQSLGHSALLSQARHFDCLSRASVCLKRAAGLLESSASVEFITLELKDALMRVQETLGKRYDDEVLDRIFKEFCIGK
jgi:tRNA modification GTPase